MRGRFSRRRCGSNLPAGALARGSFARAATFPRAGGNLDRIGTRAGGTAVRGLPALLLLLLLATIPLCAAPPLGRPASAQGTDAKTLVVFSHAGLAYSLGNELEFLKLQLQRVATRLEALPVSEATPDKLAGADYVVVFCPQADPVLPANFLPSLPATNKPVLWVGHGSEQLTNLPAFAGGFEPAANADGRLHRVTYLGREWLVPGASWIPMLLTTNSAAQVISGLQEDGSPIRLPICWRFGETTFFSAVPEPGWLSFLFADALLDFYGATNLPGARLFFRVEDYQAQSNHREFKHRVDYLFSRRHPFLLSVTPSWRNPRTGAVEDLDAAPEFVSGLRYAQQRGGRIVLHGCVRQEGRGGEFWNLALDRPLSPDPPAALRQQLAAATQLLLKHGLFPLAWQTPQDAASRATFAVLGRAFSTAVERPQLSDATQLEKGLASALTLDPLGRQIVPENLGYVSEALTNSWAEIRRRAEFLTQLRGTVSGCFIHAYQSFEKLSGLVETLEELKTPFLDLAELDNWIHVPGQLLLTGEAQQTVRLVNGTVTWKAFDRTGRLLAAEEESGVAAGQRTFRRKGKGDYELFDFSEAAP